MINKFTLLLFISFSSLLYSQEVRKGYILKNNNEKITGSFKLSNDGSLYNYQIIEFKKDGESNFNTYSPNEIVYFTIESPRTEVISATITTTVGTSKFVKHEKIKFKSEITEELFLEIVSKGKIDLLFSIDESLKTRYFLRKEKGSVVELKEEIRDNRKKVLLFRNELGFYMRDCSKIQSKIQKTNLNLGGLISLFEAYSECFAEEQILVSESLTKKPKTNLYVFAGYNSSAVKESVADNIEVLPTSESVGGLHLGLAYTFGTKFTGKGLFFRINAQYNQVGANGTSEFIYREELYTTKIENAALEAGLLVGLKIAQVDNKNYWYLGAGVNFGTLLNDSDEAYTISNELGTRPIYGDLRNSPTRFGGEPNKGTRGYNIEAGKVFSIADQAFAIAFNFSSINFDFAGSTEYAFQLIQLKIGYQIF